MRCFAPAVARSCASMCLLVMGVVSAAAADCPQQTCPCAGKAPAEKACAAACADQRAACPACPASACAKAGACAKSGACEKSGACATAACAQAGGCAKSVIADQACPKAACATASGDKACCGTARLAEGGSCRSCAVAGEEVRIDVRVLEVNVTKLHQHGFDLAAFKGAMPADDAGLLGFVEAAGREGLVQQDVSFAYEARCGQSCEANVKWHVRDGKGQKDVWRNVHLVSSPLEAAAGAVRVQASLNACFSGEKPADPSGDEQNAVNLEVPSGHLLCLPPRFYAADPEQFPEDEIRVLVLITPRRAAAPAVETGPHRDLLAPRNVLTRQAAHAPKCTCPEPAADAAEAATGLLSGKGRLSEEPPREARVRARRLFFIKRWQQRHEAESAPNTIDHPEGAEPPRGFHGMRLAA